MNGKDIINVQVGCRNCRKEFPSTIKFFYDSLLIDSENEKFTLCQCPYCQTKAFPPMPFMFFDNDENILYTVFPTHQYSDFEKMNLIMNSLLAEYMSKISFMEQAKIKKAKRRFIERDVFIKKMDTNCKNNEFILGMRQFRLTPTPSLMIDDDFCFSGELIENNLSKNDISYDSDGMSDFQKRIIFEANARLNNEGFVINLINKKENRKPSVTCGLMDIVLTVGSIIIIPILINVISDIINDLRHKKPEPELKNNDNIKVIIKEDGTKKIYYFEGNPDYVAQIMKECGQTSIQTLSIKNCHTAIAMDNMVMDGLLPSSFNHQTFNEIAKEYEKIFDINSAIEINEINNGHDEEQEEFISYKASLLMERGEYKKAYWMMRPHIEKAKSIEFFYNFSLCLSHLEVDKEIILNAYESVIQKYLACADLRDLENIDGNKKQSELDKSTQRMIDEGVFIRDEEGTISINRPNAKEEIEKDIYLHNSMMDLFKKGEEYDEDYLDKEIELNSIEAYLNEELQNTENELNILCKSLSENFEKWCELKKNGNISEEEWEKFSFLDDDSIGEEIQSKITYKIILEEHIKNIKKERDELYNKRNFSILDY